MTKFILFLLVLCGLNAGAQTILKRGTTGYVTINGQNYQRGYLGSQYNFFTTDSTLCILYLYPYTSRFVQPGLRTTYLNGDNSNAPFPSMRALRQWMDTTFEASGSTGNATFIRPGDNITIDSTVNSTSKTYTITSSGGSGSTPHPTLGATAQPSALGVIVSGVFAYTTIPTTFTATKWYVVGSDTGTVVIDVRRNGVSIVGAGNKPSLTAASSGNATISGWTSATFTEGDIISFEVIGNSTLSYCNLIIK